MVYVLLGEGFEESEAIVPVDLLRRAEVEVSLVALRGKTVKSSHGIKVEADCQLKDVDESKLEMIVIPGGLGGVAAIMGDQSALGLVQRAGDRGAYVCAICAGPTVLAHLGIADRRGAVCYPGMEEEMGSAVVKKGERVVCDGHMITAEAAGSSFEFGLKLVEVLKGKDVAHKVKQAVHYR